jgi:hypothetical protein
MPTNLISNILHLTLATQIDLINDAFIGSPTSTGTGQQPYPGQLGGTLVMNEAEANLRSSAAITLHKGIYQYVQTKAASTAAPAIGALCFFATASDMNNYIVTPDVTATTIGFVAGTYIGAPTKGNYCIIQVAGRASVKFRAAVTKATPAIGDLVVVDATPTFAGDVIADATNITSPIAKTILGVAVEAPVSATVTTVILNRGAMWPLP